MKSRAKNWVIGDKTACSLSAFILNPRRPRQSGHEASWRSGYAEDCKSLHPGSIPGEASNFLSPLENIRCQNLIVRLRHRSGLVPCRRLGESETGTAAILISKVQTTMFDDWIGLIIRSKHVDEGWAAESFGVFLPHCREVRLKAIGCAIKDH
jgi:hypothetical protein